MLKKEKDVVGIYLSAHPLDDFKREMKHYSSYPLTVLSDLDPLVNKEFSFGGIINGVDHRVTKMGKGWVIFTLEDFHDQYEFKMFGEDYLKFRHFLIPNSFIRLRVKIVEGWRNKETGKLGPPRMQFNHFEMLHDTLEKNTKRVTIQLELKQLDASRIELLKDILRLYKGNKAVAVDVYDTAEKLKLNLHSRKQKVEISNAFLEALEEKAFHYQIQ